MAAESVLFVGWNRPVVGRESKAIELFQTWMNYLGKQQQQGNVESFEPVLLNAHGGDMNGFVLIRGDVNKLNAMTTTNEWRDLATQGVINLQDWGMIPGWTGEGLKQQMMRYANFLK